jgi:ABC-type amino acid transport substrate-binding protein
MRFALLLILLLQSASFGFSTAASCTDEFLRNHLPDALKSQTITIATIAQYPPFITRLAHGVPFGFDVELMNLISFIYRINFKYQYVNPEDLIPTVSNQTYTVSITNQAITAGRIELVSFAQFFKAGAIFIAKSTYTKTIKNLTDLCGQKVAVIAATIQEKAVQQTQQFCAQKTITIISVRTFTEFIAIVMNGTANLGFQDEPVLVSIALESDGQLKIVGDLFFVTTRGILCNKDNQVLCCTLVNAINYLIKEDIYKKLLEKYSFSYKNNGICPSRINLNGTTCQSECVPRKRKCLRNFS